VSEAEHTEEGGSRSARALSREEIDALLERGFWGVLATSVDNEPYGVPIIYGYEDGVFYVANGPGRKIQMLQQNPRVTLTVVEQEDYGRTWRSVIVRGNVEVVQDLSDKLRAFNALRKQIPRPVARLRDAGRVAKAKVIRIVPTEITGRAVGLMACSDLCIHPRPRSDTCRSRAAHAGRFPGRCARGACGTPLAEEAARG